VTFVCSCLRVTVASTALTFLLRSSAIPRLNDDRGLDEVVEEVASILERVPIDFDNGPLPCATTAHRSGW